MNRLLLMLATCLAFTAASMAQGTQQKSPNPTYPPADSSPSMQQDSQPGSMANSENKGQKKIKGCIRSENGKYVLESKHHKMISLTGSEDFAPHVGHTVTVHGNFLNGSKSAGAMSQNTGTGTSSTGAPSAGASSGEGSDFQVTKMDMVSDSCTLENQKGTKGDMGSSPDQK